MASSNKNPQEAIERDRQAQHEHAVKSQLATEKRYHHLYNRSGTWGALIVYGLSVFLLICQAFPEDFYTCSKDCLDILHDKLQKCNDDSSQYSDVPDLTIGFGWIYAVAHISWWAGTYNPSRDSGELLACLCPTTFLKLIVCIWAVFHHIPIYASLVNSDCNGFSANTLWASCTMTATFEVTKILIIAIIFILLSLLQLVSLFLGIFAIYLACKPLPSLTSPLLHDIA